MDAQQIYHTLRSIAEPIHAYDEQIFAFAKWIEAEFDYKPSKKRLTYSDKFSLLLNDIKKEIIPILRDKPFKQEILHLRCEVKILEDDAQTIWVKWEKMYDCRLEGLTPLALAVLVDNIIRSSK